ncbi:MAG: DHH family phosphoesterase [Treponema sp.]|jgi:phosphoesterase RecJ-like protein|nr:DHH family phosphoesterase [Treponema sp.]
MARTVPVPVELIEFITSGSKFIVAGHKEPDGDCVGSQLALCSALRRLGKEALPCSAGPFKRAEVMRYEGLFTAAPGEREKDGAKVIIVDCSAASRTGPLAPYLEGLPPAVIDHHAAGDFPASSAESPVFLDVRAPSVTVMVLSLIEALGLELLAEEAELLFFGLCTDTGFFRHLEAGRDEVFLAAAKMAAAGANPRRAFDSINGGKSLDSRILLGHILSRTESYCNGALLISFETYDDHHRYGLVSRDSDSLYQLLQTVQGMEAIVIIREEEPGKCTVGLRSRDAIDVAGIAVSFGGGGHRNAAGFSIDGTVMDVKKVIINSFGNSFVNIQRNVILQI